MMGGPLPHVMAAKAVAFKEAAKPGFRSYAKKIVQNCQDLAESCQKNGIEILTGGTDNHLFLGNVNTSFGLTGRQAEAAFHECMITLNRNSLPFDPNGAWYTSGFRAGTAAITTLGMGKKEMKELGSIMALVLKNTSQVQKKKGSSEKSKVKYSIEKKAKAEALERVRNLQNRFPVYPQLNLELLKRAFLK